MFSKLTGKPASSGAAIAKDINDSIKTLSFLARAEKYFDLELTKDGETSKPLLKIVDIIDSLRQIGDVVTKINKGQQVPEASLAAFADADEIAQVTKDILALNPKGLVSSEKVSLSKLGERLQEAAELAGVETTASANVEVGEEFFSAQPEAPAYTAPVEEEKPVSVFGMKPTTPKEEPVQEAPAAAKEPLFPLPKEEAVNETAFPSFPSEPVVEEPVAQEPVAAAPTPAPEVSFDQPLEWDNPTTSFQQPEPEQPKQVVTEAPEEFKLADNAPQKVVAIKQSKKEASASYPLPQKYFATSYAGMNLQEAAEIIKELAENPANLDIVMLEHASRVKPVAQAQEIVADLLAMAPIADSFETGTEITDPKHLSVLKDYERVILASKDLAHVKAEGFDNRKQKLFDKFIPHDIKKLVDMARIAYPEVFSNANPDGETVSDNLLDFADTILLHSADFEDKLFAELMAQVVCQIVLYSEHNDMRFKFDLISKKNKLFTNTQPLPSRSEIAVLRSVTFIPKIARHAQEILTLDDITPQERELVSKSLDILQLIYVHARENYSTEIQSFYNNKAA